MKEYICIYDEDDMMYILNPYVAQNTELIRCKDCKHNVANRKTDPLDTADYSGIDIVCDYFMTDGQEPDDYCSHGERKEE